VLDQAKRIAPSSEGVLLQGETGSGKECVAHYIHLQSPRAMAPFVALNCAAIPENAFESELFVHVKGAYTGAHADRKGAFLEANGGTLLLDEIADLPLPLQAKLLRAVDGKIIRPLGGSGSLNVDVRIICSTNVDLRKAAMEKLFRSDLLYRIATFTVEVPPLRERRDDIVPLANYFLRQVTNGSRNLTPEAQQRLQAYHWPGNVRELRALIQNAAVMAAGSAIQGGELRFSEDHSQDILLSTDEPVTLADAERRQIMKIMQQLDGNISRAAARLGIARSTLVIKLKEHGIQ